MSKTLQLFMLLALILVGGGIEGKAQETAYKTLTFSSATFGKGIQNYTSTWTNTVGKDSWTLVNFNNNNKGWTYVRCGNKKAASIATITNDVAYDKPITKVVVTYDAISNVNKTYLEVASDISFKTNVQKIEITPSTKGDVTYAVPTPAENLFYRLTVDNKKGANGSVQISKVIYYTTADGPQKTASKVTFEKADTVIKLNKDASYFVAFSNPANVTDADGNAISNAKVAYSSSDKDHADVDQASGKVTVDPTVEGSYTITATYAGNDEYDAASASYKITVVDPSKTTWSYTFKSGDLDGKTTSYTFNNVAWNFNPTWKSNAYIGNLVDDGLQLGSAKNPATSLVFSSTGFPGIVKSVKVNAATASDANATLAVTVGGVSFGESVSLKSTSADYTFTGSAAGEVVITMSQASTSKALYIKSIEIEYNPNAKVTTIDENSTAKDFAAGTYNMVTLKRTFNDGAWNTLVVPFDLTAEQIKEAFGSTAKVAAYNGATANADNTYTLKFTEATAISANVPVLIYGAANKADGYSFADVDVKDATPTQEAEGFNFVGTYVKTTVPVGNVFINAKNVLYKAGDSQTSISGTRATFAPIGAAASAKGFGFTVNDGGQTTAINAVTMQEEANGNKPVYNLAGQRVSKAYKGVVIQNGKKFIQK